MQLGRLGKSGRDGWYLQTDEFRINVWKMIKHLMQIEPIT